MMQIVDNVSVTFMTLMMTARDEDRGCCTWRKHRREDERNGNGQSHCGRASSTRPCLRESWPSYPLHKNGHTSDCNRIRAYMVVQELIAVLEL